MRRRVIGGVIVLGVLGLCYTTPPAGWFIVCGLAVWAFSVFRKPEGSALVARLWRTPTPTKGQHYSVAAAAVGILLVVGMVAGAGNTAERVKAEQHLAEENAAKEKAIVSMNAQLRQNAPATAVKMAAVMKVAATALEAGDDLAVHNSIQDGKRLLSPYDVLTPPVPELVALGQELGTYESDLATITNVKDSLASGPAKFQEASASIKDEDYVAADAVYGGLLAKLDVPEQSAKYVPMAEVKKLRVAVESKRRAIASRVKRQELAIAKAELYAKLCGDKPTRSEWDGEIVGLERHIKESAHDPDSIDAENCTLPRMTEGHCWVSTCKVRGKNMFGAMILARKTYSFSKLGIDEI